jgi:FtsH-binding integral membrane protein
LAFSFVKFFRASVLKFDLACSCILTVVFALLTVKDMKETNQLERAGTLRSIVSIRIILCFTTPQLVQGIIGRCLRLWIACLAVW